MSQGVQDHETVSIYPLDPDVLEQLLVTQGECVFNWCTQDSWPVGVVMSYVWAKGRVWATAGGHRHRIAAIRRNPKVSVVINSTGTNVGFARTATVKGRCIIHEDEETKKWFYHALAWRNPDPIAAAAFDNMILDLSRSLDLTVFMITHDLDSLYTITDRVAVLADKRVVAVAPVQELEHSDLPWVQEYFLGPRGRAAARADSSKAMA